MSRVWFRAARSRRSFLRLAVLVGGAPLAAACGAAAPTPTPPPAKPAEKPAAAAPTTAPAAAATKPAEPTKPAAATKPAEPTKPSAAAPPAAAGQLELVIWDNANDPKTSQKNVEAFYAAYNRAQNKVRVKGVHGQPSDKFLAGLSAGSPPNVFYMWGGEEALGNWAQKGLILPIEDRVKALNFDTAQILPTALAVCKYKGKLYGLPQLGDGQFFFGNAASAKEAGLDPKKPPVSWDDWNEWTTKLTKKDGYGSITQLGSNVPSGWSLWNVVWSFGAETFNSEVSQVTPDNAGVIAALTFLQQWVGKIGYDAAKRFSGGLGSNVSPQNPFILGQLPSVIDGEWTLRYLREFKPEWQIDRDFIVESVPYPKGKAELASSMHLATYPWVIGKGAKNFDESAEWIVWAAGNKDAQVEYALAQMNLTMLIPALKDERVSKAPGFSKNVQIVLESKNVKTNPPTPITEMFADLFLKEADIIISGKESPAEGMAKVKQRVQPELDKARA